MSERYIYEGHTVNESEREDTVTMCGNTLMKFTVVIILQYIHTLNHYVVHLKIICGVCQLNFKFKERRYKYVEFVII